MLHRYIVAYPECDTIRDILEAIRDILGTFQGHFSLTFVPDLATKKLLRQSKAAKIKPVISTGFFSYIKFFRF